MKEEKRILSILIALLAVIICIGVLFNATHISNSSSVITGVLNQRAIPPCEGCPMILCLCWTVETPDETYYLLNSNKLPDCSIQNIDSNIADVKVGTPVSVTGIIISLNNSTGGDPFKGIIVEKISIMSTGGCSSCPQE